MAALTRERERERRVSRSRPAEIDFYVRERGALDRVGIS